MKRILILALLFATSLGIGQDIAQQQPQKPKLHGFKARLCAMSTVRDSPAFDACMARGFGKPRPSQPPQQATTAPQQPAPTQAKPRESIMKDTPVQAKTQEPVKEQSPVQAKPQEPIVKDTPVQAKTCIEYMTTASGAQTCLRWKDDQDQ
jgi:hypothetical protein